MGREAFSKEQILEVLLPKPSESRMKQLRDLDQKICRDGEGIRKAEEQIDAIIGEFSKK